jgi:hypothetical protein
LAFSWGIKITAASRTWPGAIASIVICVALVIGARELAKEIPDVGWRMKAIESYEREE